MSPSAFGVPLQRGALLDANRLSLSDAAVVSVRSPGAPSTGGATALFDGCCWTSRPTTAASTAVTPTNFDLEAATEVRTAPALRVSEDAGALTIDTGAAQFRLRAGGRFPFEEVLVDGAAAMDAARTALTIEDAQRGRCTVTMSDLAVRGDQRASHGGQSRRLGDVARRHPADPNAGPDAFHRWLANRAVRRDAP